MRNLVEGLLADIERFVRWLYPGLLFLALLSVGGFRSLAKVAPESWWPLDIQPLFALIVIAVVASFVIYGLQRYFLTESIEYLLLYCLLRIGPVHATALRQAGIPHRRPWVFWRWNSEFQRIKFATTGDTQRGTLKYFTYSWAVTHAMGLTAWMLPLAYETSGHGLPIKEWGWGVLVLTGLFAMAWIWQYGNNTQGDLRFLDRLSD